MEAPDGSCGFDAMEEDTNDEDTVPVVKEDGCSASECDALVTFDMDGTDCET